MTKSSLSLSGLLLALALAGSAHAATFTFGSSGSPDGNGNALAQTAYSNSGINLTIGGVAAQNGNTALNTAGVVNATFGTTPQTFNSLVANSGFGSGANWTSQALTFYSGGGLGMSSDGVDTPNHALDNSGTNTEAVLLQFSSSVVLSNLNIGYTAANAGGFASTGSDVSVLRWTGAGAPTMTGITAANTLTSGWSLVGNYANMSQANDTINTSGLGSSWWLVSAYNSTFTSATLGTGTQGNDFFKLAGVTATACSGTALQCGTTGTTGGSVPEPGSLALVAVALLGAARVKRSRHVAAPKHAA